VTSPAKHCWLDVIDRENRFRDLLPTIETLSAMQFVRFAQSLPCAGLAGRRPGDKEQWRAVAV
jgi:hypothetical protein